MKSETCSLEKLTYEGHRYSGFEAFEFYNYFFQILILGTYCLISAVRPFRKFQNYPPCNPKNPTFFDAWLVSF